MFQFIVQVDPTKVTIGEPHKIDRIDWFTLDHLPENLHSQLPKTIEMHLLKIEKALNYAQ